MAMKVAKSTNPQVEKMWVETGPFTPIARVVVYKFKKGTKEAKFRFPYMWVIFTPNDLKVASGLCRLQAAAVKKGMEIRDKIVFEATVAYAPTALEKHSVHLDALIAD
jgi:hypothetical protein